MPHPLLSEAIREAFATCSQAINVFEVIEVKSSVDRIFICTGFSQRTIQLETLEEVTALPAPFKFSLPTQSSSGAAELSLDIENVDGSVVAFINAAKITGQPVEIRYRNYIEGTATPQNPRPLELTLVSAQATLNGVNFRASIADFVNRSFPNAFYSFALFPGLRK